MYFGALLEYIFVFRWSFKIYFCILVLFWNIFVLRLFLLLVVLSMVAELGGIITLNVLGQVIRSEQLIFFVADLDCISCNKWTDFADSCGLYLSEEMNSICWQLQIVFVARRLSQLLTGACRGAWAGVGRGNQTLIFDKRLPSYYEQKI